MNRPAAARTCRTNSYADGVAAPPEARSVASAARSITAVGGALVMVCSVARAETWRVETFGTVAATATNNVNLAPPGQEKPDLYFSLAPGIRVVGDGARLKLSASYVPTFVLYTNTASAGGNRIYNNLSANASLEAIEKFFFVDARWTISNQFINPFAPQPQNLGTNTNNRSQLTTYGISPYFRGVVPGGGTRYLLRNDAYWIDPSGAGQLSSFYNTVTGLLENTVQTVGWGLDYLSHYSKYVNSNSVSDWLARARLIYRVDPQLNVFVSGGYNENNYALSNQAGPTYGGGFTWRPTQRTNVVANYEHRFFGASYLFSFDHRTPLTAWNLSASRNISSYPQQALALPPGNTASLLDSIFAARIPDPAARAAAVDRFIQQAGLPEFLAGPQSFYTQQIFLTQPISASFGILGVRNTITFLASRTFYERISGTTGTPLPDVFAFSNQFISYLVSANWSHQLTGLTTMNLYGSWNRVNNQEPTVFTSTTNLVRLTFTTRLSPKTDTTFGARYTIFNTDLGSDYREAAIFALVTHRFY